MSRMDGKGDPGNGQDRPPTQHQGPVALVQFLAPREESDFAVYRAASRRAVVDAGGTPGCALRVDQVLAGGPMPYRFILVDSFPDQATLHQVSRHLAPQRRDAVTDLTALLVGPDRRLPWLARRLSRLAPLLSRLLGTRSQRPLTGFAAAANGDTGPVPDTLDALRRHDQNAPFYMMNLNRYFGRARYADGRGATGEQAYRRYAIRILPYLLSVGGYPALIGPVLGFQPGGDTSPLQDTWDEFALVYYPSRRRFLNMMTHTPAAGLQHRTAGLQRAVLMPSSPLD